MTRLNDIRKRLEEATPGPWEVDGMDSGHSKYGMDFWIITPDVGDIICDMDGLARAGNEKYKDAGGEDAWFIANARQDVEDLLGAVEDVLEHVEACEQTGHKVDADFIKWLINKRLKEKKND